MQCGRIPECHLVPRCDAKDACESSLTDSRRGETDVSYTILCSRFLHLCSPARVSHAQPVNWREHLCLRMCSSRTFILVATLVTGTDASIFCRRNPLSLRKIMASPRSTLDLRSTGRPGMLVDTLKLLKLAVPYSIRSMRGESSSSDVVRQ
jgi:hypothetical protein